MANSQKNQSEHKILFLGTQMAVGGAQQVLISQANWFHQQGYPVIVAFFYDKENLKAQWDEKYPFPGIDLQTWRKGSNIIANALSLILGLIRLWILFRKEKIRIVETFTPDSNMLGLLVARLAGVPVRIATHHGVIEGRPQYLASLHGWMVNQNFANKLVAVSEQVRQIAIQKEGIRPEKVAVILNGIQPQKGSLTPSEARKKILKELNIISDARVILAVGRVTPQKGYTYLLDAAKQVLDRVPQVIFVIAGDGHSKAALVGKADRMGLNKTVHFIGTRADIPDLLSAADLFVMPSLSEGMPIALLEAMDMGVPVVASKLEQISAFVNHNEHGLLVEPEDVSALANSIVLMLEDQSLGEKYGTAGQALVRESYTADQMCRAYERLFIRESGA